MGEESGVGSLERLPDITNQIVPFLGTIASEAWMSTLRTGGVIPGKHLPPSLTTVFLKDFGEFGADCEARLNRKGVVIGVDKSKPKKLLYELFTPMGGDDHEIVIYGKNFEDAIGTLDIRGLTLLIESPEDPEQNVMEVVVYQRS